MCKREDQILTPIYLGDEKFTTPESATEAVRVGACLNRRHLIARQIIARYQVLRITE
jgi:hypothetical protein